MSNLSWTVGRVKITRVVEFVTPMPSDKLIPEATPENLAPFRDWMYPDFMTSSGYLLISIHALAIESRGKRIVVDTCIGEHVIDERAGPPEPTNFLSDLAEVGFTQDNVDVVLCTHMHFDHVGWNTMVRNGRWVPTFPNARYLFSEKEWNYARHVRDREHVKTFDDTVVPVVEAGLADFVDMRYEITDEIRLRPSPGHTPGHVCVEINSQGARALITGDATHNPIQWAKPDWEVRADDDHEQAVRTRRKLSDELIDSDTLVIGTHYRSPTAGYVKRGDKGVYFHALRQEPKS